MKSIKNELLWAYRLIIVPLYICFLCAVDYWFKFDVKAGFVIVFQIYTLNLLFRNKQLMRETKNDGLF